MKFDVCVFFENLSTKVMFHENLTIIADTSDENLSKFITIARRIFLRLRNVSSISFRENQNTHFMLKHFVIRK
jgi:hypothetical protein